MTTANPHPDSTEREDFSLAQLARIRRSIEGEIEIIDEELDDPRNKDDLDLSRKSMLKDYIDLQSILAALDKLIRKKSRSKIKTLQAPTNQPGPV
jgi:hypothetical protein